MRTLIVTFALVASAALVPAVHATDPPRALRVAIQVAEAGFDPAAVTDTYSRAITDALFEPLYTYDYYAQPVKLITAAAAALPEVSSDGRTFVLRVKPGLYFADDPAFKGKRREVTSADFAYAWRRLLDPKVRSYYTYLLEDRLEGASALIKRARTDGSFDYTTPIAGLATPDRYTLRVRFTEPFFGFPDWLTSSIFAPVAREVVEAYQDASRRVMENPVGNGPYRLGAWVRGQKIVLVANPNFRDLRFPAPTNAADAALMRGLPGRKLPLTPRIEISVIEEALPRLLAFDGGALDLLELPPSMAPNVLEGDHLKLVYAKRNVVLQREVEPSLQYTFINLDDPLIGGTDTAHVALRRAIALGFDRVEQVRVLNSGQGLVATQLLPPMVPGHDSGYDGTPHYDPATARTLLDRFGYRDRDGDGYRETPDGKPLAIVKGSVTTAADRALDELWKKDMDAIGLRMTFVKQKWPELVKMGEAGQLMMWNVGWITSLPDPDQFMALLYSKNIGTLNDARLRSPEYDQLLEESRRIPPGPAQTALFRRMNDIMLQQGALILNYYTMVNWIAQPHLRGFKLHPFLRDQWAYYAVE